MGDCLVGIVVGWLWWLGVGEYLVGWWGGIDCNGRWLYVCDGVVVEGLVLLDVGKYVMKKVVNDCIILICGFVGNDFRFFRK